MGLRSTVLLSCAALAVAGGTAEAREHSLRTGSAHVVVVSSSPSQGLEEGISRNSWYAKGIALDAEGRFDESYAAYREAQKQFQRQLGRRPRWGRMIRGWILKAEFQMQQSARLRRTSYGYRTYYRPSYYVNYYATMAKHNKWLAVRAFSGRSSSKLRDQIIDEYSRYLQRSAHDDRVRLLLAAFYHEIGRREEGRRQYAQVRRKPSYLAKELAYYHTAAGNIREALRHLSNAVSRSSGTRRYVMQANDFDRLRDHPEFKKLVEEPYWLGH